MKALSRMTGLLLVLLSPLTLGQAESYSGIWRDAAQPESYYSLHVDGNEVVLIALSTLERTGTTLAASFHGRLQSSAGGTTYAAVEVLQPHPDSQRSAEIFASAPDKLRVYWCNLPANSCVIGIVTELTKVF